MFTQSLSLEGIEQAKKYVCSTAFCFLVCDALHKGKSLTAVRAGDGEAAIIRASKGRPRMEFLDNAEWLCRYGVLDYPLDKLAEEIVVAGNNATWFGPSIAGLELKHYSLYDFFYSRLHYIPALFPHMWAYCGHVEDVIKIGKVFVACRNNDKKIHDMTKRYKVIEGHIVGLELDNYHDRDAVCEAARSSDAALVIISGGPTGKSLIGKIARGNDKVVLDCGNGLISRW